MQSSAMKTNEKYQLKVSVMLKFYQNPIMNKELQKIKKKTFL